MSGIRKNIFLLVLGLPVASVLFLFLPRASAMPFNVTIQWDTPTVTPTAQVTATPTVTATCTVTVPARAAAGSAAPNPFRPGLGQKVRLYLNLTNPEATFSIRILTVKGRVVRTLTDTQEWDGRDERGRLCEGGLYLYQIQAEGKRQSGTVVMIGE
jgi:hypothetical protein